MLHTVTRFPGVNSHSCRMLRTNATRTLTFGAKRNGKGACRCARYADRSCRCLPALDPTLVASMDGRPCTEQPELAGRGSGGTGGRNHRAMQAGKWGRLCHRSSWQRIGWSSEVPSAGSGVVTSRAYGLYLGARVSPHQAPYWIVDPNIAPAPRCRAEWLSPAMEAPGSYLPGSRS